MDKPVAVLLSGNGVFDGSEIHESVLTLLALAKNNIPYQCIAPDVDQHHVINHTNGEEMNETRNVLIESARIARGEIKGTSGVSANDFSALVMPGGFGAAKNLTKWAFSGPEGEIEPSVKKMIAGMVKAKKPVLAMCMSPVVVAKALEGTEHHAKLTVGTTEDESPYDIQGISDGMGSIGAKVQMAPVSSFVYDDEVNVITSPCYMMDATIDEVNAGIEKSVARLKELLKSKSEAGNRSF